MYKIGTPEFYATNIYPCKSLSLCTKIKIKIIYSLNITKLSLKWSPKIIFLNRKFLVVTWISFIPHPNKNIMLEDDSFKAASENNN